MDRTYEFRKIAKAEDRYEKERYSDVLYHIKRVVDKYSEKTSEYRRIIRTEKRRGVLRKLDEEIRTLLEDMWKFLRKDFSDENIFPEVEGNKCARQFYVEMRNAMKISLGCLEKDLENIREKRERRLFLELEPEKPVKDVKDSRRNDKISPMDNFFSSDQISMRILEEENEIILRKMELLDAQLVQTRQKISKIDELQTCIKRELLSQGERVDEILKKSGAVVEDVKISKKNIYQPGRKGSPGSIRNIAGALILIFSLILLLSHLRG